MANEPTITEMNYVIGVFDGRRFSMSHINDYTAATAPKMKYHNDWNWLMRVGKKIYTLLAEMAKQRPPNTACQGDLIEVDIQCHIREYNITGAHKSIYELIMWLNQQKKNDDK